MKFLDAQLELENVKIGEKLVTIISYPYIEGCQIADNVAQFVAIARRLQEMHAAGWCHADVREANMVFTVPAANSRLIDFDFSHEVRDASHTADTRSAATYPPNWNPHIEDGKRHASATAGAKIRFEHDIFSLQAVMRLYGPSPVAGGHGGGGAAAAAVAQAAMAPTFSWDTWTDVLNLGQQLQQQQQSFTSTSTKELLANFIRTVTEGAGANLEDLKLCRKQPPHVRAKSATQAQADFALMQN
jgi:serine/threonine protein kinase